MHCSLVQLEGWLRSRADLVGCKVTERWSAWWRPLLVLTGLICVSPLLVSSSLPGPHGSPWPPWTLWKTRWWCKCVHRYSLNCKYIFIKQGPWQGWDTMKHSNWPCVTCSGWKMYSMSFKLDLKPAEREINTLIDSKFWGKVKIIIILGELTSLPWVFYT